MPGNFDQLLNALAEVQARRPGPPPAPKLTPGSMMAKALPKPARGIVPELLAYAPYRPIDASGQLAQLKRLASADNKANAISRDARKREQFFKSLSATRASLGRAIKAGTISADDAIIAEAKLHRLATAGLRLVAAERAK